MVPRNNAEDHYLTTHAPVCRVCVVFTLFLQLQRFNFTEICDKSMKLMFLGNEE